MKSTNIIGMTILSILFCCERFDAVTLNSSRIIRQSKCWGKFQCANGDCIDTSDVCNGLPQCSDSSDESFQACKCGITKTRMSNRSLDNSLGVQNATLGFHPWLAGVHKYRLNHFTFLCTGTLIYDDIVLTAAKCLYDIETSLPYPQNYIYITIGKEKRDYKINETFQQNFGVSKIQLLDRYEGEKKSYARNLAIIKLNHTVRRTNFVLPICLLDKGIPQDKQGIITGWGLQSKYHSTQHLQEARVQMLNFRECYKRFYDPLLKKFITNDKFCITYDKGVDVEAIDIGGPVTIVDNGYNLLVGVLSWKNREMTYGIATIVEKYIQWIQNTTYDFKTADSKFCSIPEDWEIYTLYKCTHSSGCQNKNRVPNYTTYVVTCNKGPLTPKPSVKEFQMTCVDGIWVPPLIKNKCQECGILFNSSSVDALISVGTEVKDVKYPWHIALHWLEIDDTGLEVFTYQCGGTIIDNNKVLTAAHCVQNQSKIVDAKLLKVSNGRIDSIMTADNNEVKTWSVAEVKLHNDYTGSETRYANDIAVLILSKDIKLTSQIMPACLNLDGDIDTILKGQIGHVVGWGAQNLNGPPTTVLHEGLMGFLDVKTCRTKYNLADFTQSGKFCATYINGSGTQAGDSGGALTFIHGNLYYAYGIVSIKRGNQNEFSIFTDVNHYKDMITSILKDEKYSSISQGYKTSIP